jgi:hypothetical protein
MKNLLLIAFATLTLMMGANLNACPSCEGKSVKADEKKVEKVEVKKTDKGDVKVDVKKAEDCCPGGECPPGCCEEDRDADKVVANTETKTEVAKSSRGCAMKKASAGQMVKADKDCAGSCKKASAGQTVKADGCGGCGSGCGGCGSGCGGCDKGSSDCGGCNKAEAKKPSN